MSKSKAIPAIFFLCLWMLPGALLAEECQVAEFADHFDVTCTGDARPVSIPRQMVTAVPAQNPEQYQSPEQQKTALPLDLPASAQTLPSPRVSGQGGQFVKKPGRQGRPGSADIAAAIEARRKLIQEQSSGSQR